MGTVHNSLLPIWLLYVICWKKMIVMLNTKDMPEDIKAITGQFIKEHVDLNKCKLAY